MILIIEGCDKTGKTTLAQALSVKYKMPIIHFSYPKTHKECLDMFNEYQKLLQDNNNFILDRCWYSEMIYGKILRYKSYISEEQRQILETLAQTKGCQIYYCYDTVKNIHERFVKDKEDFIPIDKIDMIVDAFDVLFKTVDRGIPVIHYKIPIIEVNENV